MKVFRRIDKILTLTKVAAKKGKLVSHDDLNLEDADCLVEQKGRIAWIGKERQLPAKYKKAIRIDLKKKTIMPAFVECHTHTVFGGNRSEEFELRQQGMSYQEIAKRGGGIRYTVEQTRRAKDQDLKKIAQKAVDRFVRQGVTSLEVKSGYGLNLKEELRILKIAANLKGPRIIPTYLGPHALSPEEKDAESYLQKILKDLPKVKKFVGRVDMFIEDGYFSLEQGRRYYEAAKKLNMQAVVHADQMTRTGASRLAAEIGALSCDHVIHVNDEDIKVLAKSQTTAVLLPTSDQYIQIPYPKARQMLEAGVRVALATDYNPGTSPTQDLSYVGVLARVEMKMLLHEVIAAYTYNAAAALGLEHEVGSLQIGKRADFIVLDNHHDLFYKVGESPVEAVYREGKLLSPR